MSASEPSINTATRVRRSEGLTRARWTAQLTVGGLLGTSTGVGALVSHAAKIGLSGGPVAEMWPLALLVLAASAFVLIVRRNELPVVGRAGRLSPRASDEAAA